jgi:hydroxymethylpyrimidine/phosphomethylpyrimidine kinase
MIPRALTIAGSDSGGGAGIQADLKTFMAHGVYGASAITAITAQNTVGVHAVLMLEPSLVVAQIEAVLDDIGADAVKTGMLGNASIIQAVAETLERYRVERLVIDPVMVAKSGARLLEEDAIATLRARLLPLALVVTPNLPEASVLLNRPVTDERDMQDAARDLHTLGPRYVLLKGGHLSGAIVVDLLYDGERFVTLRAPRLETNPYPRHRLHLCCCHCRTDCARSTGRTGGSSGARLSPRCHRPRASDRQRVRTGQPSGVRIARQSRVRMQPAVIKHGR